MVSRQTSESIVEQLMRMIRTALLVAYTLLLWPLRGSCKEQKAQRWHVQEKEIFRVGLLHQLKAHGEKSRARLRDVFLEES